jgi:hypothetical protein
LGFRGEHRVDLLSILMSRIFRWSAAAGLLWSIIPARTWAFHVGLGDAVASQGVTTLKKAAASSGYGFGPPVQFSVDAIQNPSQIYKVSKFYSCLGHPYPEQNSPNSGKRYFYPTTNSEDTGITPPNPPGLTAPLPFPGNSKIFVVAPCDGTILITSDDASGNGPSGGGYPSGFLDANGNPAPRGFIYHLSCANSQTSLRFFHLILDPSLTIPQTVTAGTVLGNADVRCVGYTQPAHEGTCSDFDIAVSEGNDNNVIDYFAKLTPGVLAADWPNISGNLSSFQNPASTNCPQLYPGTGATGYPGFDAPQDTTDYPPTGLPEPGP